MLARQADCARAELESVSTENKELKILSDGLCRVQTEEGKALREAGIANWQVERLTNENVALAGHNNTKQKIRHLEVGKAD